MASPGSLASSTQWPLSRLAMPSQSKCVLMRPITISAKISVNARLRNQYIAHKKERSIRGRNAATLIAARLVSSRLNLSDRMSASRSNLRPSTSPSRMRRNYGRGSRDSQRGRVWKLHKRLSPLPGFQRKETSTSGLNYNRWTQNKTCLQEQNKYIHVKFKYTRWMRHARIQAANRPGFVADDRALMVDPVRKDALLIRTGAPRAGQPFETHVHHAARIIQRRWRLFFGLLCEWAATLIQCSWRQHCARLLLKKHQVLRARHNACIYKMRLLRCHNRIRYWREVAVREIAIKDVGRRFLSSCNQELVLYAFGKWWEMWHEIREKNDHTVFCFHRWRTHKLRCRGFYTWVDQWLLVKALRNFIMGRLYRRWHRSASAIRCARIFGIETRAATSIQRAYRAMRSRDYALMEEMNAREDVVAFKARRQRSALLIQCCARIWLSKRRFDARSCTHFVLHNILLGKRLKRLINTLIQRKAYKRAERAERIRQEDEMNFVVCELKREEAEPDMRPTFSYPMNIWGRGSWSKCTQEGRAALLRVKRRRMSRIREARHRQAFRSPSSIGPLTLRHEVEAERLRLRALAAQKRFRERWPPPFECTKCRRGFAFMGICCSVETLKYSSV